MNQTAENSVVEAEQYTTQKTINIIVAALGGQGGGVLIEWLARLARGRNWPSQNTSVPGVAQRTGATIYYLEVYPENADKLPCEPVMSLFPMPQNVDLVVASEVVEAGRMVQRGYVTPERTTVVTSTHRVYAIDERVAIGDAVADSRAVANVTADQARQLVMFDMQAMAEAHDTVISATLFGAVAGSGRLPFAKQEFAAVIRTSGIQVEANLNAFQAAYERAQAGGDTTNSVVGVYQPEPASGFALPAAGNPQGAKIMARIQMMPGAVQEVVYHGARRLADYLDFAYVHTYLDNVSEVLARDSAAQDYTLTVAFARHLALWCAFEDIVRVAHLKVRRSRYQKLLQEVRAEPGQIVEVKDFFKPRTQEIFGLLPYRPGKWLTASPFANKVVGKFTAGKQLATTHVGVYLTLRMLAGMRRFRRRTYAYKAEQERINTWRAAVIANAGEYSKAEALASAASLIKGYSHTRQRGYDQVAKIVGASARLTADDINTLVAAGLTDDTGTQFCNVMTARKVG